MIKAWTGEPFEHGRVPRFDGNHGRPGAGVLARGAELVAVRELHARGFAVATRPIGGAQPGAKRSMVLSDSQVAKDSFSQSEPSERQVRRSPNQWWASS